MNPLPGAFAPVTISLAIGAEPSEQISTIVAMSKVMSSPVKLGPSHCANISAGTNVLREAAMIVPKSSHLIIIFPSLQPDFNMLAIPALETLIVLRSAVISDFMAKLLSLSLGLFGFSGRRPALTQRCKIKPEMSAITIDPST